MSEDLKQNPGAMLSEEIQEDVSIFRRESGIEGVEVQDYHHKLILLNFLDQRLVPLSVRRDVPGVYGDDIEKRNSAVRATREWGIPHTQQEASIAGESLRVRLEKAGKTKNGSPERAVDETYNAAVKYWKDSKDRLDILRKATQPTETEPEPDAEMIKGLISTDQQFMDVYADYFLDKENLDHYNWRKNQKDRKKSMRGAVVMMAQFLEPDRLVGAHKVITDAMVRRLNFWSGQIKQANELEVIKLRRADPESQQATLTTSGPGSEENLEPHEAEGDAEPFSPHMPEEVKKELTSKYEKHQRKIETMVDQGIPRHVAELRELGAPGIYDIEGVLMGVEPPDESRTRSDAYITNSRPKKTRNNLGPNEKRIADRDATVKVERELLEP